MSMCVCGYEHLSSCTWRLEVNVGYLPQSISTSFVLRQGLSPGSLGWLAAGPRDFGSPSFTVFVSPCWENGCVLRHAAFYTGAMNSGPHACVTSTLPTQPSPWPTAG